MGNCGKLTLRIQEIANWHGVALIRMDGGISKHLIPMTLRSDAHIFLTKCLHMCIDIRILLLTLALGSSRDSVFKGLSYRVHGIDSMT